MKVSEVLAPDVQPQEQVPAEVPDEDLPYDEGNHRLREAHLHNGQAEATALFALTYALIEANEKGWTSGEILGLFGIAVQNGLVLVTQTRALVAAESAEEPPLLWPELHEGLSAWVTTNGNPHGMVDLVKLARGGHTSTVEAPELVNPPLVGFLEEVSSGKWQVS